MSSRVLLVAALLVAVLAVPAAVGAKTGSVRFATFNASLNRNSAGQALSDLSAPGNAQADAVAEIIQRVRPDVLLINEFDYYPNNQLATAFQDNYLDVAHNGAAPIDYPYVFVAPSNTGQPSGLDLDNNGSVGGPNDAFGFGFFPGQYGLAVFSRYPIDADAVRTFQMFLWKDMPGALLPDNPTTATQADWYSPAELDVFRLSSKSHWDVPIEVGGQTVHFLVSHPTPPVFDDPPAFPAGVDFNGRRNSDEIRFWADYITPGPASRYIYDDAGESGGLKPGERFVIAGDQNSDPLDGDSIPGSIQQLIDHPLVNTKATPASDGGPYWAEAQDALNDVHESDPLFDTADFCDTPVAPPCSGPGNLRADYVLPRKNLQILGSGVFWPDGDDPLLYLTGTGFPVPSSDHRAVWVDVKISG
ncbi:MAG TPA: endonuclease/exonuclease/phosphatase family protein [Candidatus Limnocylindrales bacterium]|nr:endonuclease/exonuclease/phosphatase family protein [Candidatus Limnocylindrales bacterium]